MKAGIVFAILFLAARVAVAQDDREETKKKILKNLEKGIDALLKFGDESKRAMKEAGKFLREKYEAFKARRAPAPKAEPPKTEPPRKEPTRTVKTTPKEAFSYNVWDAWSSFKEDSSVTLEMTSEFGGSRTTMKMTTTVKRIESDRVTLEDLMEMSDNKLPATTREIRKPADLHAPPKADGFTEAECPACKKRHKAPIVKESLEKIKVGEKELDCTRVDSRAYQCEDKETVSQVWYSKEVPGWIVKFEFRMPQGTSSQKCLGFQKK